MADEGTTTAPAPEADEFEGVSLAQLKEQLTAMEFVGADILTSRGQAIAVINGLREKEKKALENAEINTPTKLDNVKDNESADSKKYFGKAAKMKEFCDSLPKVDFIIPLGFGEKKGAIETWQANGYKLNILKGVRVRLPSNVADDLATAYQLEASAGDDYLLDRPSTQPNSAFKTVREALE